MNQLSNKYDLEERTAVFGENILEFCRTIKQDVITRPLINQIIRSGASIGANYYEANNASSKKDFRNKIFLCKKESQETKGSSENNFHRFCLMRAEYSYCDRAKY